MYICLKINYWLASNISHPRKSYLVIMLPSTPQFSMQNLLFWLIYDLPVTNINCVCKLLGPVCQFWVIYIHYPHTMLVIMKNCRYRYQIQSFWHCFTETFQTILAVFAHTIMLNMSAYEEFLWGAIYHKLVRITW